MAIVENLYEEKTDFNSFEEHLTDKIIDYIRDSYGCEEVDYTYFFKNFEICLPEDFKELFFYHLEDENAFDLEVIYFANAISYLKEHDPSLQNSLGLASELGLSLEDLNSEWLASLLKSENEKTHFLENILDDLYEQYEYMYYEIWEVWEKE